MQYLTISMLLCTCACTCKFNVCVYILKGGGGVHLYRLQVIGYTLVLLQLLEDSGKQPTLMKVHYPLLVANGVHVVLMYCFHIRKDHSLCV